MDPVDATRQNTRAVHALTDALNRSKIRTEAEAAHRIKAWRTQIAGACRLAIKTAGAQGRTPWAHIEIRGHHSGHLVEVYPGVRGKVVGRGTRQTRTGAGLVVQAPYVTVKVNAQQLLAAIERAPAVPDLG